MSGTLLIANRGEIAIRIARTASAMGWRTVAVHSSDDASALHTRVCDTACALPGAGPSAYLDMDAILAAARQAGADAVHPGYGFLSERADFAAACEGAGLSFVGPSPQTLTQLGDKAQARALAQELNVPVIPGTTSLPSLDAARAFWDTQAGAPILLKAVHGGGGRGMRVVHHNGELASTFEQCQAEAIAAFGQDALYAERYLPTVRHIEVQVLGDGQNVTHLWERDCTLQRRNQKLLELAPAPNLPTELRDQLLKAACDLTRAAKYRGIGTIEFLVDTTSGTEFYFIEANPRIQVEHTITEEITGVDLVETQLRLAKGETLEALGLVTPPEARGSAIQARINAERQGPDGVTASNGVLEILNLPGGPGVRVDTHAYQGAQINAMYDALLAKLIVHDHSGDVGRLLSRLHSALTELHIGGLETNTDLLTALVEAQAVKTWDLNTHSFDQLLPELLEKASAASATDLFQPQTAAPQTHENALIPDGMIGAQAPMQALVHAVNAQIGDEVSRGDEIIILEAMKMQHVVTAPTSGRITELRISAGDLVNEADVLVVIDPTGEDGKDTTQTVQIDPDHIRPDLAGLQDRQAYTLDKNRPKAVARRRDRGQMTTREVIAALLQDGDFQEYGQLVIAGQRRKLGKDKLLEISPADGIVTGVGTVNGDQFDARNKVAILAYDSTVMAGTQGAFGHIKTDRMFKVAADQNLATIFFTEGGGGRPNDDDFAHVIHSALDVTTFSEFARLRGWGPKITVNSGFCFAGNAALFGTGDIRIATKNSWIGLVDILCEDDAEATAMARRVLSYFQGDLTTASAPDPRHLRHVIPEDRKRVYDIRSVIQALVDDDSFTELGAQHAPGMVQGLARIDGRAVGLIANNPKHLGGALDAQASLKAARFLRLCDRFNLPVVSLCDTPGFMVGPASEADGGVRAACELIDVGANLRAPLFFIALRKGYGIGAQAMAGGSFQIPAFTIAWPTGEFGAMGLEGAARLGYKNELAAQPDETSRQALYDKIVGRMYAQGKAINVASYDEIDAVIDPAETRDWIRMGLDMAKTRA